ncbi:MAG: HAD-IIB family hydrolase [Thermodesulfobacteriota bacterium]|nr:HAD-IIB family hydrolase [Thermodesulfobacteriota bacterium]
MKKDDSPDGREDDHHLINRIVEISEFSFFIVFTDLDGTLLDKYTYEWKEAVPALDLCKRLNIPVVLTSSKTRTEINSLRSALSISAPFISENGGGIFVPDDTFEDLPPGGFFDKGLWKWSLGLPYSHVVKALREIREEIGLNVLGFSDMSIKEISDLTGLGPEASRLATLREYDEPFVIVDEKSHDMKVLYDAAARRGLTVIPGGRFYHLQGNNDKGHAIRMVVSWYRKYHSHVVSIALGDSPNDFPMLEQVDFPVLIRSQRDPVKLTRRIPRLMHTSEMGPKGWNAAVLDILSNKEEKCNA